MVVRVGSSSEVVTFVETLLPDGVDAIFCGGIAYVADVRTADDLPEWASATIVGGTAYVPETLES